MLGNKYNNMGATGVLCDQNSDFLTKIYNK